MTYQNLSVLWVRDGRPGHEKQSLGLIASLQRRYAVQLQEIRVRPGTGAIAKAIALLLGPLSPNLASFSPDLIIGTGSHTHFPILALQKRLGGRTVVCMSPMAPIRARFDLCCVPRHDGIAEDTNIILTDGPPGVNTNLGQHDPGAALVLVGGVDEKSHIWDNEKISQEIAALVKQHPKLRWTLTTSPRTPPDFLTFFAGYQPENIPLTIAPFRDTPPGWLEKQLQKNNWVVVTEDSVSMIFEALSAGCHVATVPVEFLKENKFVRCLRDLQTRQLIQRDMCTAKEIQGVTLNEADRCVSHMLRQDWWPLL